MAKKESLNKVCKSTFTFSFFWKRGCIYAQIFSRPRWQHWWCILFDNFLETIIDYFVFSLSVDWLESSSSPKSELRWWTSNTWVVSLRLTFISKSKIQLLDTSTWLKLRNKLSRSLGFCEELNRKCIANQMLRTVKCIAWTFQYSYFCKNE